MVRSCHNQTLGCYDSLFMCFSILGWNRILGNMVFFLFYFYFFILFCDRSVAEQYIYAFHLDGNHYSICERLA